MSRVVRGIFAVLCCAVVLAPLSAMAQDSGGRKSVDIFLDDEQLDVEADIPSVDLVLAFKGLRYENLDPKRTFLPELYDTVENPPF